MCNIRAVSIVQSAVSIESQMPDEQYPCSIRVQYPEVSTLFVSSIRAVSCSILQYSAVSCPSMCEQYPCITYPQHRQIALSDCFAPDCYIGLHISRRLAVTDVCSGVESFESQNELLKPEVCNN